MRYSRLIKYLREKQRISFVPSELNGISPEHRHKFYNPNYVAPTLDLFAQSGEFDFEAMVAHRENTIGEFNSAFFLAGGKDLRTDFERLLSRLKYAAIREGGKKYITFVDKETMKAYRMANDSYYDGLIYPLVEIPEFVFDHFCSGLEL